MAKLWGLPDVSCSWLPDDEGHSKLAQGIRVFMEDRSTQVHSQAKSEDVRSMKGLLSELSIDT